MFSRTESTNKFTQAMNTVGRHVGMLGESFGEVLKETGIGIGKFFGSERSAFSDDVYSKAHAKAPILSKIGEPAIRLFANTVYLVGRTFKDIGTAIGTGAAMMVVAKNGEEAALGAGVFLGGIGGAAGLIAGGIAPKPVITVPSIVRGGGGAAGTLALATSTVQIPAGAVAVPAVGVATSAVTGPMLSEATGNGGRMTHAERYKKMREDASQEYASELHNDWRGTRTVVEGKKAADGLPMREARWKKVDPNDPALKNVPDEFKRVTDKGVTEVDIANLDFKRLPASYQAENLAAAKGVVDLLLNEVQKKHRGLGGYQWEYTGGYDLQINTEAIATKVHEQWMARNRSWAAKDAPELMVPFKELTAAEQAKDVAIVKGAVDCLNKDTYVNWFNFNLVLR